MATILTRSFGEQGNQKKFTISVWVKRCNLGSYNTIFSSGSNNYATRMYFDGSTGQFDWWNYFNGAYQGRKTSNARYRDTNGYYHIVCRYDSASSTASERMRMYINGEQVTSLATSSDPNQNQTQEVGHTGTHYIGGYNNSADFDGLMSHYHYCDNYSYAPTEFGETDSTTGEWKIKTSPSVSYGTTGFFILKDGNSVTDQSGLSHNWTVGSGTLTKTEDNPSNVFCTVNPLDNFYNSATLTNGNTTVATGSGNPSWNYITSTLGVSTGKWYWEVKDTTNNSSILGFAAKLTTSTGDQLGESSAQWGVQPNGRFRSAGSDLAGVGTFSFGQNDIVGIALDATNKKVYFHTNGTYGNSGNPSTGANGITIASPDVGGGFGWYFPAFGDGNTSSDTYHVNFGNGYFGSTQISSAGTNASGIGIFEYDVPTGYTALSTKGLNL